MPSGGPRVKHFANNGHGMAHRAHRLNGRTGTLSPVTTNPWLQRRVLHYAHQGGAREAPSSTLFALRQALGIGADAIELDVHRSADGVLMVCHDATVDRTTASTGLISELTLDELRDLDNAYWWVPGFESTNDAEVHEYVLRGRYPADRSLGIATLEEILTEFPTVMLNFDIKDTAPDAVPYEHELADTLRRFGRRTDVIVASFHDRALRTFREYAPDIHTSAGPREVGEIAERLAEGRAIAMSPGNIVALQVPYFFGDVQVVTPQLVKASHQAGLAVHVWTIDEPVEMDELLALGVDGIMTDCPTVLAESFARNNAPRPA